MSFRESVQGIPDFPPGLRRLAAPELNAMLHAMQDYINRHIGHNDVILLERWPAITDNGGQVAYDDPRYWVSRVRCTLGAGDTTTLITLGALAVGDPRILQVTATNLAELVNGTHGLEQGEPVEVWVLRDLQHPAVPHYVFNGPATHDLWEFAADEKWITVSGADTTNPATQIVTTTVTYSHTGPQAADGSYGAADKFLRRVYYDECHHVVSGEWTGCSGSGFTGHTGVTGPTGPAVTGPTGVTGSACTVTGISGWTGVGRLHLESNNGVISWVAYP